MNKNIFLLCFVLCCGLPLLAAKVVLDQGWYQPGSSSRGQWLQQEYFLLQPAFDKPNHWRVAVVARQCEAQRCQKALHTVKQLYIGLGRKQTQVQPVYIGKARLIDYPMFLQQEGSEVGGALENHIVLVDQNGLALLRYPMPEHAEEMAATAKAIRADLMKLLSYDRTSV